MRSSWSLLTPYTSSAMESRHFLDMPNDPVEANATKLPSDPFTGPPIEDHLQSASETRGTASTDNPLPLSQAGSEAGRTLTEDIDVSRETTTLRARSRVETFPAPKTPKSARKPAEKPAKRITSQTSPVEENLTSNVYLWGGLLAVGIALFALAVWKLFLEEAMDNTYVY